MTEKNPAVSAFKHIVWRCVPFEQLKLGELYALLKLRSAVFVVEQQCAFQDLDDADQVAHHLMAVDATHGVLAYTRLVPAGVKYAEASIGRVLTGPQARGMGMGHELMARSCEWLTLLWGAQPIRIGAQAHLQDFYHAHGFITVGEPYMEDGIPHVEMLRQPTSL
ncbi:MAG: hypothetical protein RLZZ612_12 [Pseudomonadota bacterium]